MAEMAMVNGRRASDTFKPKHTTLALTEYAASPTPQLGTPHEGNLNPGGVPEDLLLPNGYPDVSTHHKTLARPSCAALSAARSHS
jgi:threonine dehydratase